MSDTYATNVEMPNPNPASSPIQQKEMTPAAVRKAWQRGITATREQRRQAAVNDQYMRNRHWLRWNRSSERLEEIPRDPDRVRATVARLGPDSHRILAKLTSKSLRFEVPPNTPDDQSIQASRVAMSALSQVSREQDWDFIRYEHALACWTAATAGLLVEWDDTVGTPVAIDETTGRVKCTGDVRLTVIPLHEMAFEPGTRNAMKSQWWVHGRALPPDEVQETYNLAAPPAADARAVDSVWNALHHHEDEQYTPLTMVYTYWEKPRMGGQGRCMTCVGEQVVEDMPWPYPWTDRLNIAIGLTQPITGRWYGHTPVTDAVPVQTIMNAAWSSIVEHMKQAGNASLMVPEGSVENIEDWSDQAGEAREFNAINGMAPHYVSPPAMPDWWVRAPEMFGSAMDDILGQHDVSRGQAPPGVEAGIAMSILAENDDTPIGRFGANLSSAWGHVGSMVLKLYEARVRETRQSQVMMPHSGIPEIINWTGDTLAGHTTATVTQDVTYPRSRSAQAAWALQLNDRGIIQSPLELARVMDLPEQNDLIEGMDPDTARAMRENAQMAAGKGRTVDTIDDHKNHILHHRNFMRSQRFEYLDQETQQMIRWHVSAHEQYIAQSMAQMAGAASVSPIAASMPSENVPQLDPQVMAQMMAVGQLAPSSQTAQPPMPGMPPGGAPGAPPDMSQLPPEATAPTAPPPGAGPVGPPAGGGGPPPMGGPPSPTSPTSPEGPRI